MLLLSVLLSPSCLLYNIDLYPSFGLPNFWCPVTPLFQNFRLLHLHVFISNLHVLKHLGLCLSLIFSCIMFAMTYTTLAFTKLSSVLFGGQNIPQCLLWSRPFPRVPQSQNTTKEEYLSKQESKQQIGVKKAPIIRPENPVTVGQLGRIYNLWGEERMPNERMVHIQPGVSIVFEFYIAPL